jgi:hypothetical protein|tara:strand:- start:1539 stop:1877 length:339 start_codon:yes stop_codon:yes gene_type:complete
MRVILESPYSGREGPILDRNVRYARQCLMDSISRGESPFSAHLLYTQVLDDNIPEQRSRGMALARPWYEVADLCAVYIDLGITQGMEAGIAHAESLEIHLEERRLGHDEYIR